jgi:predicted porin
MKKSILLFTVVIMGLCCSAIAQSDMDLLGGETKTKEYVNATFKGTRITNFHTIENPGKRSLEFRISHRFGPLNSGAYQAFGLDGGASIRLGLEYSYNGLLALGIGRTSYEKTLDFFAKYKLLRQTTDNSMPISLTLFTSAYYNTLKDPKFDKYNKDARLSYCHQIMIARKFNEKFSFQIAPTAIHFNLVDSAKDKNNAFVLAMCTRYKINKRTAITLEYGYRLNKNFESTKYYDSFAVGIDIETGGHVFQMHFTNSFGIVENQFLARTSSKWSNAGIRLGFNVSRMFNI